MLAPVVNMLEIYHFTIPTLVLGSLALASGITAFLLPETRRTELPGSTEEAEGKRYMYYSTEKVFKTGEILLMKVIFAVLTFSCMTL